MNVLKDFFMNLFILVIVCTIPFILFPELMDSLKQSGTGIIVPTLLFILLIILAIPSIRMRR